MEERRLISWAQAHLIDEGHTPATKILNEQVATVHMHAEKAILPPGRPPAVTSYPVPVSAGLPLRKLAKTSRDSSLLNLGSQEVL